MRVLLLDDDAEIRLMIGVLLGQRGGVQVTETRSLKEGRAQLASGRFDLLLLDRGLPDGTGDELLQELRADENHHEMPIVIMTGQVTDDEILTLKQQGAQGVIRKPFNPMTLWDRLDEILA